MPEPCLTRVVMSLWRQPSLSFTTVNLLLASTITDSLKLERVEVSRLKAEYVSQEAQYLTRKIGSGFQSID